MSLQTARRADRRARRAPARVLRAGESRRRRSQRSSRAFARRRLASSEILRTPAFYLLAIGSMCSIAAVGGTNQHLKLFLSLDRGYSQGGRGRDHLPGADDQHRRPAAHGMAGGSHAAKARDAADLPARRRGDSAADGPRGARRGRDVRLRGDLRARAGRRVSDHPADGGGTVRHRRARPRDGDRADRGRRRRGDGTDAGRLPARPRPAATTPDSFCW